MLVLDGPDGRGARGPYATGGAAPGYARPSLASQVVQAAITGSGWILFLVWWVVVLRRETIASFWTSALSPVIGGVAVIAAATALWIVHNRRLARKGQRGTVTRYTVPAFRLDLLGRPLRVPGADQLQTATQIVVTASDREKVYEVVSAARDEGRVARWN
jgi:hypothetical protein